MRRIHLNPTVRVSLGMLMLTLSIVFAADWLGLIPHQQKLEMEQRKRFGETLAVQLSSLAQSGATQHIRATLTALVERDSSIASAAFRTANGGTLIEAGDHADNWTLAEDAEYSTMDQVTVPIYRGDERWGSVQLRFDDAPAGWYSFVSGDSFIALVLFLTVCGAVLYFLFLRRVLRELDPRHAIPERVKAAFNSLAEGVVILDENARMVLTNTAFTANAGLDSRNLLGVPISSLNWSDYKSGMPPQPDRLPWSQVIADGMPVTDTRLIIHKDSNLERAYALNCTPIKDGEDEVRGVIVTFDDLTELERKNETLSKTLDELQQTQADVALKNIELQQLATKDPLTNCLNRRAFNEQSQILFDQALERETELVCIMADIDHFKRVNDTYGHGVGDKVIKFVAEAMRKHLRKDDLLGRYGGEEFCVILNETNMEQACNVAERIRREVSTGDPEMFTAALRITSSFGLASIRDAASGVDDLVNKADKALYLSKEGGRNKVTVWEEGGAERADAAPEEQPGQETALPVADVVSISAAAGDDVESSERIRQLETIAAERAEQFDRYVAYDQTTQLPVRSLFIDRVEQSLLRAGRDGRVLAVLSLSLSNLKRINDTLGHDAAQELMRQATERLQTVLRDTDTVSLLPKTDEETTISKLNEGEFGLLLPAVEDPESITWIVKRIFDALREPLYIDDHHIIIEGNVGIGVFPADGGDAITLIRHASISRHYAEQQAGPNNVEYYSEQINRLSREQLRLESEMSAAIDAGQFRVVYQPKVALATGQITGFEALLRWNHPVRGLLTPNEFIEIAERTRLINLIGDWVLRRACLQISSVSEECGRPLTLAVNLSPVQFSQPELVDRIMEIVHDTGTNPELLELELTESCLMDNFESTFQALCKLQAEGVKISIDDFGTGYSGLSYLRTLPINNLKIDRSFIADIHSSSHDKAIVAAIIGMAKALSLSVIAEGVETARQLEILTEMQCEEAQGYLFSRPVSINRARELALDVHDTGELV